MTLPATVRFARPVRETVLRTQLLTGKIGDSPADEATVSAPALGRITDLVALGTMTEPGDIVAIVEPPVLRSPASEDRRNSLAAKVGRLRQLETEGLVAREELKSAEAELQHLDALHADSGVTYELRADRRGEVVELLRPVGAEVDVGTEVLRVRGVGSLEVTARVAEPLVADLEEGLAATITVTTRPGRTWTASIARLTVEPGGGRERGVDIVFRLDGDLSKLTSGLTAIIELAYGETHEALTVPRSAIVVSDGQLAVVVRTADGTRVVPVVTREITTYGTREITVRGTSVEVLEGLNDDAEVAVEGAALFVSPAPRYRPRQTGAGSWYRRAAAAAWPARSEWNHVHRGELVSRLRGEQDLDHLDRWGAQLFRSRACRDRKRDPRHQPTMTQ